MGRHADSIASAVSVLDTSLEFWAKTLIDTTNKPTTTANFMISPWVRP